jgi:hypothetical protein
MSSASTSTSAGAGGGAGSPSNDGLAGSRAAVALRTRIALWTAALGALAAWLANSLLLSWDFERSEWMFPRWLPTMRPFGNDFFTGIYEPAVRLREGIDALPSFYPPLVTLLGVPATFFDRNEAYVLNAMTLVAANVASLVLATGIARTVFGSVSRVHRTVLSRVALPVLLLSGFTMFTSYAFLFSIERGNYDALAVLPCIAVIWLLVHRPDALWAQTILLAVAVHLKVYPLAIFPVLFWRHRWRSLLPFAIVNVALLFVLGWGPIRAFLVGIRSAAGAPAIWSGNHSGASFALVALGPAGLSFRGDKIVLALLPLAVLAAGALVLWRRGFSPGNALLAYVLAVPAMNLVPGTSHDYKLVILGAPMAVLLLGEVVAYAVEGGWRPITTVGALLVLTGLLTHAYELVAPYMFAEPGWLVDRYLWILLVQLIALGRVVAPGRTFYFGARAPAPA